MKFTQYFKNVSLLVFINFAIKPIWVFLIERQFQNILPKEEYGLYFSHLELIYIFSVILDFGLHNYAVKSISERKEGYKVYNAELWISKSILIGCYLALVSAYILFQDWPLAHSFIFFLIALEFLIFSLYQFLRSFVQGLQMLRLDSFLSSFDRVVLIVLGGGLLHWNSYSSNISLLHFIGFHILAYGLCFSIVFWFLKHKISFSIDTFSLRQLTQIIKEGWPLIVIVLLMTIYSRIGSVLLGNLLIDGLLQCHSLALSNRIVDSAYNTLALLSVFLLPSIAFHFAEKKYDYIEKVVFISFLLSTILSLGFIFICLIFGEQIYHKLYPASSYYDLQVFKAHAWSALGIGWMYVFGSYLTATSRFKTLIIIVSLGVILALGCYLYFIPLYKALGAATVAAGVQLTMGTLHLLAAGYYIYQDHKK